jgi:2-polyprenyl-6-methoxyphenol hydroxylase-like FAD-dependent oxidoreductase
MIDAGDVLIVGAGPTGLFTALALAQEGVRVTVIEAEADICDAPRAPVYFPVTMTAFDKMGVLDDLDKASVRVQTVGHRVPEYNFHTQLSFNVLQGVTYDYQLHAGQDVAARIACEHARRLGVQVLFNHKLVLFEQHSDNVITVVDTAEGPLSFQSKWLIGCDGARSIVRKSLDIDYEGFTWPNRFVATNVYCDFRNLGIDDAGFICDPVHSAMICVIDKNGLWRLTYQEDGSLPEETFMDRLPEQFAAHIPAGIQYELAAAAPYTIHQRCAAKMRVDRVMLAGDSAHCTNPMGGLGFTTGIWDGLVLADVLAAVIRGEEDESILDRYSVERRRVYLDISSPAASSNKRMIEQSDPAIRKADMARIQEIADNADLTRLMMCFPFRTIGNVLRPNSRWKDISKSVRDAGIDIDYHKTQFL